MAGQSWPTENIPKKMRGYLEIEDDELKFFTKRFFVLRRKKEKLEYYREDPFVSIFLENLFYTILATFDLLDIPSVITLSKPASINSVWFTRIT